MCPFPLHAIMISLDNPNANHKKEDNMNRILSIFVCIAMLLSVACFAEEAAPTAMAVTISDVVVSLNGEDYALPQTATLNVAADGENALLDFFMTSGEDTLFPIQAKMDEAGLSLLLGTSNTAYVFSTEYLSSSVDTTGMPESFGPLMESYFSLLSKTMEMSDAPDPELQAQMEEYMVELAGDSLVTEETTLTLDGAEVPATHMTFSLDMTQIGQLVDYEMSLLDSDLITLYLQFMSESYIMVGEEPLEVSSFAELYAMLDIDLTMNFDLTLTEDGAGEGVITVAVTAEDETVEFPIYMTVHDEDTAEVRMNIVADGEQLDMTALVDGTQMDMDLTMNADDGSTASIAMSVSGDESSACSFRMTAIDADGTSFDLSVAGVSGDDQRAAFDVFATLGIEDQSYGLSFHVAAEPAAIEDRIAAASPVVITSDEDEAAFTGLGMAAMGMMGDVEKLMNDESFSAMTTAFSDLYASVDDGFELYPDDDEYEEDDLSDLSYELPEFTWLPEGYELTDTWVYADLDNATLVFEYTGDDDAYHSSLNIELYGGSETTGYIMNADGTLSSSDAPVLFAEQDADYLDVTCYTNGFTINVYYYGDDLTVEDAAALINGIVFAD